MKNIEEFSGKKKSGEWASRHKKEKTERAMAVGRRTREGIVNGIKCQPQDSRWGGGTSDIPGIPLGPLGGKSEAHEHTTSCNQHFSPFSCIQDHYHRSNYLEIMTPHISYQDKCFIFLFSPTSQYKVVTATVVFIM